MFEPNSPPASDTEPAHMLHTGRAVDPEQLILKGRRLLELLMNAVGQCQDIVVTSANNDACMRRHLGVQADKVPPIKCHDRSTSSGRKR